MKSLRRRAPFVEWVNAHKTALVLAAVALIVRIVYVYGFTDYSNYLYGDMGGYWNRAYHRYSGRIYGDSEFNMWPVAYHLALAWGIRLADFVGLAGKKLEFVLFLQILAQSISVGMFFEIAEKILRSKRTAIYCALVYAVFYQLVYLNAFVLTENAAIPLFIAAVWLAFTRTQYPAAHIIAALFSAIAAGFSPRFGPFAAPLAVYLLLNKNGPLPRIKRLLFPITYALGIAFFIFVAYTVSGGKVRGLGPGGHAFMLAQCKVDVIESKQNGYVWVIVPPTFTPITERKVFTTHVPFYEQDFWYGQGWQCIKDNPKTLIDGIWRQKELFYGPLFPSVSNIMGYAPFMAIGSLAVIIFYLIGMFIAPFFWNKFKNPMRLELWFLWSLPILNSIMTYLFTVERRYMFPMIFVITLLTFSIRSRQSSRE